MELDIIERLVLQEIADQDLSPAQIAQRTHLSIEQIQTAIASLLRKAKVSRFSDGFVTLITTRNNRNNQFQE